MSRFFKLVTLMMLGVVSICNAEQFNIPNGDVAALKAAIIKSNSNNKPDTIHLAPFGTYALNSVDNTFIEDNGLPIFLKDGSDANFLVIFGNGATIIRDASITTLRLMYFEDCKVSIYDTNFIGGTTPQFSGGGGAIHFSNSRITFQNCLFKNNRAAEGGAMWSYRSTLTFKNSTFTNNIATAGSGSVFFSEYGTTIMENCVVVNNSVLNVSQPAAIFNLVPLNSNTVIDNIYLKNCIVAKNTYDNVTSPDNGKEFDLAGAVYTNGGNLIGRYPVVSQGNFPIFKQGQPSSDNDYVGTDASPIDPLLGTLGDHGLFTDFYDLQAGSKALLNGAGIKNFGIPAAASNGVVPSEAYPGDIITITGINLVGVNKIQFPGASTTNTGINATARSLTVPVHPNSSKGQILMMDGASHFVFTNQVFTAKAIVTPNTPSNFAATAMSTSSIKLTWNDLTNEEGYQLEYKKHSDVNFTLLQSIAANVTQFLSENLLCAETYDFRVIALGHGVQSSPSTVATKSPLQLSKPVINPPAETDVCEGVGVTLSAPDGFASYKWNTTETTESIVVTVAGDYSVKVTDASGCESSFSEPVTVNFRTSEGPEPATMISGDASVIAGSQDHIYSVDSRAGLIYEWTFSGNGATLTKNNNEVSIDFSATATSGTLSLELSDNCGTSAATTLDIHVQSGTTGLEEDDSNIVYVSPNPSSGKILIDLTGKYEVTVIDMIGKVVLKNSADGPTQIDLGGAKPGVYVLVVKSDTKVLTYREVIH